MKDYELIYLKDKVKTKDLIILKDKSLDENILLTLKLKSPKVGLVLSIAFGTLAIDRFYKGDYFLGAIKLFLFLFGYIAPIIYTGINSEGNDKFTDENSVIILWFLVSIVIIGIWHVADWFLVYRGIKDDNFKKILTTIKDEN